jgi:hypothetical protein
MVRVILGIATLLVAWHLGTHELFRPGVPTHGPACVVR